MAERMEVKNRARRDGTIGQIVCLFKVAWRIDAT